ncbi:MAG: nucleotidyltransferase family protein [Opitutaceae bacterium]|nr:nucleotidyltransferase family protein [Opitutaceae bacterium]
MTTAAANTLKTSFVAGRTGPLTETPWSGLVPEDLWASFQTAVSALDQAGVPFLLHGAIALATYTGHWRNTKDIDIIVHPGDHERAIDAIRRAGFEDYFDRLAYDRSWIFRALKNDGLIDIIWDLPNHRVPIDHLWFARAWPLHLRGRCYAAVPPEELVRVKLYVMQRERCD